MTDREMRMECLKVAVELQRQRLLVRDAKHTSQAFDSIEFAERLFKWVWMGTGDPAPVGLQVGENIINYQKGQSHD